MTILLVFFISKSNNNIFLENLLKVNTGNVIDDTEIRW